MNTTNQGHGRKPTLTVLFGQPEGLSTTFQTTRLVRALTPWFEPHFVSIPVLGKNKWVLQGTRVAINALRPILAPNDTDYLLYANDGVADVTQWHGRRVIYWYDAPRDWSSERPQPWQVIDWLRCRNIERADHVFAVSHTQVGVAQRLRPGREGTVHYLPVGVDCQTFDPARADPGRVKKRFGVPEGRVVVGYLGYIGMMGGRFAGEPLAEMAPALAARHDVHFLVVGRGPGLEAFKRHVADKGMAGRFTFTGYVEDEIVPSCIAAMDICIDTLEKGFHSLARSETKLKQYMAMGRACVATGIGENRVDLDEGAAGVLVEPESDALLQGVASLCDKPELRAQLGNAARARALELYDWPRLAERMARALGLAPSAGA